MQFVIAFWNQKGKGWDPRPHKAYTIGKKCTITNEGMVIYAICGSATNQEFAQLKVKSTYHLPITCIRVAAQT